MSEAPDPQDPYVLVRTKVDLAGLRALSIQRLQSLVVLSLVDCQLQSLRGVPALPSLLRLDLDHNLIAGPEFLYLRGFKKLAVLNLTHNRVGSVGAFSLLKDLELRAVGLQGNPIVLEVKYRLRLFDLVRSLTLVDGRDIRDQPQPLDLLLIDCPAETMEWFTGPQCFKQYPGASSKVKEENVWPIRPERVKPAGKKPEREPAGVRLPVGRVIRLLKERTKDRVTRRAGLFLGAALLAVSEKVLGRAGSLAIEGLRFKIGKGQLAAAIKECHIR